MAPCRVLHLRLVLLRPNILSAARQSLLSSSPSPPLSRTEIALRTEVSTLCVEAANSAICMLHADLRSVSRIISSNAVFVTLSAATVVVAASLVLLDVSSESQDGLYTSAITKALHVLEEHQWQVEEALAARNQLERFLETVNQAKRYRCGGEFLPRLSFHCGSWRSLSAREMLQYPNEFFLHAVNEPQVSNDLFQNEGGQLLSEMGDISDVFDINDPLWEFQWGDSFSQTNVWGPNSDISSTKQ